MGTPAFKDITILLVDDEPDFREAMGFSFERLGCQVLMAANGREAFNIVQEQSVDVVISDIRMPGGDGLEFLDRVKATCTEAPIILLITGYTDASTEDILNKGAEALFSKPFHQKALQETVLRLMTPVEERWCRSEARMDVELQVELQLPNMEVAIAAKVVTLGRGGIFISLEEHFPNVNDITSFKIIFEGGNKLEGSGIVRWVRNKSTAQFYAGCGLEFSYLGESEREWIIEFIRSRKMTAFIPNK